MSFLEPCNIKTTRSKYIKCGRQPLQSALITPDFLEGRSFLILKNNYTSKMVISAFKLAPFQLLCIQTRSIVQEITKTLNRINNLNYISIFMNFFNFFNDTNDVILQKKNVTNILNLDQTNSGMLPILSEACSIGCCFGHSGIDLKISQTHI